MRYAALAGSLALCALAIVAAVALGGAGWIVVAVVFGAVALVGVHDVAQRRHSILRNYPILGHARFALEAVRPELQQYFIERNYDGRPFDRDTRTSIYERAKGDQGRAGLRHRARRQGARVRVAAAVDPLRSTRPGRGPRVTIGGPDCSQPYEMALLNVSAMSFGALSGAALTALNRGRGQGRLRPRHRRGRADQVPPQRRRRGLGDRHRLLRRAGQGRRLRSPAVPREGVP